MHKRKKVFREGRGSEKELGRREKKKKITYTQKLIHPQAKMESGRRLASSIRKLNATTDDSGEDDELIGVTPAKNDIVDEFAASDI